MACSALYCKDTSVVLSQKPQNPANPTFLKPATNTEFTKYAYDTEDATEAEMVAVEYICSYNPDVNGEWWLVSEEGKPVIKLTTHYVDHFGGDLDKSPTTETYSFIQEYFQAKLSIVRADLQLQEEAQKWLDGVKATQRTLSMPLGERSLEERYVRCGSSRCQSQRTCINTGGTQCSVCARFVCYYTVLPDGCWH
ncbi:hypothetical protein N7539_009496 [Penicillium diatomitis]|uniref:Uncharacterized protein n=1 Tax=Penicillium diatomitis TaxID=2819901 RepID=A0A9X0BIX7_9EURO|nr:uncharacterized protein N7539_009496 [Penicillium diatomitis]KAJ5466540.1 hypothetical protein N7539_009496 [Penicillium diatomitis]